MNMTSGILEALFGSSARTRILRLFLLNQGMFFSIKEIARRTKTTAAKAKKEMNTLEKIGFVKKASEKVEELIKLKNGKVKNKKSIIKGFKLNPLFSYLNPLKSLFVDITPISKEKLIKRVGVSGRMKLIILSGIFIQDENSRVDILLVGDSLKRTAIERTLKNLEMTMGRELNYAILTTQDFMYRMGVYDRFVRDILDYPHEKIFNKLEID